MMTSSDKTSQVDYSPLLNPTDDSEDGVVPDGQHMVVLKAPADLEGGYELAVNDKDGGSMVVVVVSRSTGRARFLVRVSLRRDQEREFWILFYNLSADAFGVCRLVSQVSYASRLLFI